MAEVVLGFGRLGLVGPGAFSTTNPVPSEVETQTLRWASTKVQFQSQYSQVLLLAGSNLYRLTIRYLRQRASALSAQRTFYEANLGMEGTFPFTHPVEGWTRRMRFARPMLAWALYPPNGGFYDFTVELEEAP